MIRKFCRNIPKFSIQLPPLPYGENVLSPHISKKTVEFHYEKHHRGYVDKLNELIKDTELEGMPLEQIILLTLNNPTSDVFNNAAQAWNHAFYWQCMNPKGSRKPQGELVDKIGNLKEFKEQFIEAAGKQFGSGWIWLVDCGDTVDIITTSNALIPSGKLLLVCDLWEHAYYLDWQNERKKYVEAFLNHLLDWDFVSGNYR